MTKAIIAEGFPIEVVLKVKEEMSDEELFAFCAANKHVRIERDRDKTIIIMAPVGAESGNQHTELIIAIGNWNKQTGAGKVFDSSTGFLLPDGSMRSPDAAFVQMNKWNNVPKEARTRFLPFAPDFVVELQSKTDSLAPAQEKMRQWINNGTSLGWLILPKEEIVFIYRADGTIDKVEGFEKQLSGEDVLPNFVFDLSVLI